MAKNYLQEGKTLTFIANEDYKSGDMVPVGDCIVISVTDTPKGCAGTGLAEGVFTLPKKKDDNIHLGQHVYFHEGVVVSTNAEKAIQCGIAWENAGVNETNVAVKI